MISLEKRLKIDEKEAVRVADVDRPDEPQYPYGLLITLDTETLKRLNIDPYGYKIGDNAFIYAKLKVVSISQDADEKSVSMQAQLTDVDWMRSLSEMPVDDYVKYRRKNQEL